MYLYSKRPLPIRAKKDIKCYKQLVIEGSDIKTPYIGHLVEKAKWRFNDQSRVFELEDLSLGSHVLKPKFSFIPYIFSIKCNKYDSTYEISKGFIHSYPSSKYLNIRSWKNIMSKIGTHPTIFTITLECTIPKGTLYYIGRNDYASRKLIVDKIL